MAEIQNQNQDQAQQPYPRYRVPPSAGGKRRIGQPEENAQRTAAKRKSKKWMLPVGSIGGSIVGMLGADFLLPF